MGSDRKVMEEGKHKLTLLINVLRSSLAKVDRKQLLEDTMALEP